MILSQFDKILQNFTCFLWHFRPIPLREIVNLKFGWTKKNHFYKVWITQMQQQMQP